jgi:rod shape determining protein RodA
MRVSLTMLLTNSPNRSINMHHQTNPPARSFWGFIHIDFPLLLGILLLLTMGLFILYSASSGNILIIQKQLIHLSLAFGVMFIFAQIPPIVYQRWAIWLYLLGVLLLFAVLMVGHTGKGAERWLNLGIIRFQPSEMMKLALPMFLACHFHKIHLPLTAKAILFALMVTLLPALLAAKQPDLSTAFLLVIAGFSVLFIAGLGWRFITIALGTAALAAPILWYFMHDYQRKRIFTFLNPERDPLGAGYHIIQSKIAIGSGGLFGKGWLNGTQSHLRFLPESPTDFIFAVCGEELGFIGSITLIVFFMIIILRGLYITINAQDTFSRLLAGSLTFTFFVSFFTNMGMVTGILPVMGLPLPLVSYGGSSMVTLMASFGILMSIQTHRKLLTT